MDKSLYLSVDEGKTWDKTAPLPVWLVKEEQGNIYTLQGTDQDHLAIYKYNPLAEDSWEKICDAPSAPLILLFYPAAL
ncbi:MAG: hypothetical protein RQM92_16615 [Candidatus Syntrophopropionicum ammoniitolerans]